MRHGFGHHWMYGHPWGNGFTLWPGMLLSALSMLLMVILFIGLAWAFLSVILPSIKPLLIDIFGLKSTDTSALEILRERFASGEIDAQTFEQMRVRLITSYEQESTGMPRDEYSYYEENLTGYGHTYGSPVSQEQGRFGMAEQDTSETEI